MARFEGVKWAPLQVRYLLSDKQVDLLARDDKVFSVSKSVFYATFLCFEGIRFFCRKSGPGKVEVVFLNWHKNLERFRRGISFNLGMSQQAWVPSLEEIEDIIVHQYFRDPETKGFLEEIAEQEAQGYLRPFTVDEEQSMGVTFPNQPSIRALFCKYDRYLGEPFTGVVTPGWVRAMGCNGTGCLKLGVNYLISLKAVDAAKSVDQGAASALFLDDKPHLKLEDRTISEWDSSCCLFGFRDGTIVKIPESDLILPSITIQGMVIILKEMGIRVDERPFPYGELVERVKSGDLVVAASVGTAGIMNRCEKLVLVNAENKPFATHVPEKNHELYTKLGEAKTYYWNIYKGEAKLPQGMNLFKYVI